ncbi:MAG: ATP-binding cassette domain-containing protein [Actinomycetota bacterium]|nr:daunorubicin ABC transporter ATP-binding protein [Acidimicrobiaceae bacterium]MCH2621455.1 ATP-binding cassette domain-containing protein [Acidimicrobiales bacterium]MEC7900007.1 ATP-binding cassette domain-containing protein [Actinomycetota bacterium]
MNTVIETRDLVRRFGEIVAVDGINLSVSEGQVFGFLGPNGAGKSTAIRMLTTLLHPTSGEVYVSGFNVVTEAAAVRRLIGVALQDAAIDPLMTANELIRLQAVLHGITRSEAKKRGGELLERVGLSGAASRRVSTFSGGMRRRLDLALSLIHEPRILFLDEPTTGLDPTSREALWNEVKRLNTELGTTVFLTTQYLEEADQLAHEIAIIDAGRIARQGIPKELKENISSPTLRVDIEEVDRARAQIVLDSFGERRPAREGRLAVGLDGGATRLAEVVRAFDEAGISVEHLELDAPSLDDVFAEATGRRLEGVGEENE